MLASDDEKFLAVLNKQSRIHFSKLFITNGKQNIAIRYKLLI